MITKTISPITNDPVWTIGTSDYSALSEFFDSYRRDGYGLKIYDQVSKTMINITCDVTDMPYVVTKIASAERSPITDIRLDSIGRNYIVGLYIVRGLFIQAGTNYKYENFEFIAV